MKISVITVAYNSAATITDTVESVLRQTHTDIEYLIIDGGSSDETISILEPYRDRLAAVVSEPDQGMYDAMNKGVARATGDIVAIINSDDLYTESDVLAKVAAVFEDSGVDCVYGDLNYVAEDDLSRVVREWKSGEIPVQRFAHGWHPPHPAFFVRRSVYGQLGRFRLDMKIAADYEFMLRVLQKASLSAAYLPEVLVDMRMGGASNRSIRNILVANWECMTAWRVNGYSYWRAFYAIFRKPIRKLGQFLIWKRDA